MTGLGHKLCKLMQERWFERFNMFYLLSGLVKEPPKAIHGGGAAVQYFLSLKPVHFNKLLQQMVGDGERKDVEAGVREGM